MSELDKDNLFATGEAWFLPPDGILDGSNFDIAQRFIEGARADIQSFASDETMDPGLKARHDAVRPDMETLLDSQETRLKAGDASLAALLTHRLEIEVDELNRGERSTITGQRHLLAERLRQVGHIYYVPRPTNPDL